MRAFLVLLVAQSAAARIWGAGSALPSSGGFSKSARQFTACQLKSGDVDLDQFGKATQEYCELIRKWGSCTAPSISQVYLCLAKIDKARRELERRQRESKAPTRLNTMKLLLESEAKFNIHKPGAVLADPSGAMGLLWVRRGLVYWLKVFELEVARLKAALKGKKPAPQPFREQCKIAYEQVLKPFHGWVSRRGFGVALRGMPEWSDLRKKSGLPKEDDQLMQELQEWIKSVTSLHKCMVTLQTKFGMEDLRKSI
ncbi:hypothetical protein AB1Y20_016312 [Prymnesium parvum]|uniref:Glycolipid transfer protein domain-containing protein n=1 Tax=Prymnesium parvum TaxID=97485 RepID=A0AB34IEV3_PRYPA